MKIRLGYACITKTIDKKFRTINYTNFNDNYDKLNEIIKIAMPKSLRKKFLCKKLTQKLIDINSVKFIACPVAEEYVCDQKS